MLKHLAVRLSERAVHVRALLAPPRWPTCWPSSGTAAQTAQTAQTAPASSLVSTIHEELLFYLHDKKRDSFACPTPSFSSLPPLLPLPSKGLRANVRAIACDWPADESAPALRSLE